MELTIFLIAITFSLKDDKYGVLFEDDTFTELVQAPEQLIEYTIPITAKIIRGGSEKESAFIRCRTTISNLIFPEGSQIQKLESFCFYSCSFNDTINLSNCRLLLCISESAFRNCEKLKQIHFPPNLERLCAGSFGQCISLKDVTLPDSLISIDDAGSHCGVFLSCKSLTKATFGSSSCLQYIGINAFALGGLQSFYIPKNVSYIDGSAFTETRLSSFDIDPKNAYFKKEGLLLLTRDGSTVVFCAYVEQENFSVPTNITIIGSRALRRALFHRIFLPDTLKQIHALGFFNAKMSYINVPRSVTLLDYQAFSYCPNLVEIELNSSAKAIPNMCFSQCKSLESITIPRGVVTISGEAFFSCTQLKYIWIPNTTTSIGSGCFYGMHPEAVIVFENGSEMVYSDKMIFSSDKTKIIACFDVNNECIKIGDEIEIIGSSSFRKTNISQLIISSNSNLTTIEDYAFYECPLTSLEFNPKLTSIGKSAFYKTHLSNVDFSKCEALNLIKSNAFEKTMLSTLVLHGKDLVVSDRAFYDISSLSSIVFDSSVIEIGEECFARTSILAVKIPWSLKKIGANSFKDSSLQILVFEHKEDETKDVNDYAFFKCTFLTSLTLCEGIINIGNSAFENCISLKNVTIPKSTKVLGMNSFSGCTSLNQVNIQDGSLLEEIGELAFLNCKNLVTIDVSETNTKFVYNDGTLYDFDRTHVFLFLPASGVKTVVLPSSVQTIAPYSFQNANEIEEADLSSSALRQIGYRSFKDCSSLSRIKLPSRLQSVGSEAFAGCSSLDCGSVEFIRDSQLEEELISAGIPVVALHGCQTKLFTPGETRINIICNELYALLIQSDNSSESKMLL